LKIPPKNTDIKQLYQRTLEQSLIVTLLSVIAFFLICPAPKPKMREQRQAISGFIVEDVPVTRQGVRLRPPAKPALPIPVDDPAMAEDETIEQTLLNFDAGSTWGEGTFAASNIPILPPRPLVQVMPEFPPEEKKRGVSGTVVLRIEVNEVGAVTAVVVAENTTNSKLCEQAAIEAAKNCRYQPARQGQKAVTAWTTCSYGFYPQP